MSGTHCPPPELKNFYGNMAINIGPLCGPDKIC